MSKAFCIAVLRGHSHRGWTVRLSDAHGEERYVSKGGAVGYLESIIAQERPVLAIIYEQGSESMESVWYYEPDKVKRKLNVLGCGQGDQLL